MELGSCIKCLETGNMKIIYNNLIPFKGFSAINILGIIFAREGAKISDTTIRHEKIHSKQQKELLWLGFYIWYLIEWLVRVLFTKDVFSKNAYRNISFEREAYDNQDCLDYKRRHFNWIIYFFKI